MEMNTEAVKGKDYVIDIDLQSVLRVLHKYKGIIMSILVIAVVGALIYSFATTRVYQGKSRLIIDRRPPKIVKVEESVIADYNDQTSFLNSQIEILKSRTLATLVLQQLPEYQPWDMRGKSKEETSKISDDERLDVLVKNVKISPVRMTQIIDVIAEDPDPKMAARIANIWAKAYVLFSSMDQLFQRRSELESDLYQRSKYLKEKNPVILGLKNEIQSIDDKIKNERLRLSEADESAKGSLSWSGDIANVKVLERAKEPTKPVRPQKALALVFAVLFGLFASGVLVLLLESMDHTINTAFDLEQAIKMSCLVTIPQFKNKNASDGIIPELASEKSRGSLVAESFRHLRTSVVYSNPDFSKQRIMIASSSSTEGKTLVAANLATVFAQTGERTLLVDTDMRCPRVHTVFNFENTAGLSNILAFEKEDIRSFIHKTEIPNLDVLTSGAIPPNPSELLVSHKMEDFIAKVSKVYDRIIFDSPPVLAATDAVILSAKVDATILVVRSGFAHRQAVLSSVKALNSVNARILTVVLNMVDFYGQGHHYGYSLYEPNTRAKFAARTKSESIFKR